MLKNVNALPKSCHLHGKIPHVFVETGGGSSIIRHAGSRHFPTSISVVVSRPQFLNLEATKKKLHFHVKL